MKRLLKKTELQKTNFTKVAQSFGSDSKSANDPSIWHGVALGMDGGVPLSVASCLIAAEPAVCVTCVGAR